MTCVLEDDRRCVIGCRSVKSGVTGRELAVKKLADLQTISSTRQVYNELCALTHLRHENVGYVVLFSATEPV